MKKILFISIASCVLWSCSKNLTDKNVDPKNPTVVPSFTLFTNAEKKMADLLTTSDVNTNIFRLISQQWTQTTYLDESNYDLQTRSIPNQWWNGFYQDVLKSLAESKKVMATDVLDAGQLKNEMAMADILQVFGYYHLVSTFGNIPYTEALNFEITQPVYDDAATIYADLLARLDADITALDEASESFGSADLLYGGDVAKWKLFANSLKLKMALLIADSDANLAKSAAESAAPNIFTSNDDNAIFAYLSSPPNTNPVWADQILSGRTDFVAADVFVDALKELDDPRIPLFFTEDNAGGYTGGIYGSSNAYSVYSKPSEDLFEASASGVILSYAELQFLLAEAAERGFDVGGTAQSFYNEGITASIAEWGGSAGDATAYLANPDVNYATAEGDWKQKIGTQAWIALFSRGYDAWTSWRKLDYPQLTAPADALTEIPVRFTYSVDEQNLNKTNFEEASSKLPGGQDVVTAKLWFDTF